MTFALILTEKRGRVGIITLHRPEALNALNTDLIEELNTALDSFETDDGTGCIVVTGSERAFAAGADIKEMCSRDFAEVYKHDFIAPWERIGRCRKPVVAAVSGYALGGGCELAMMCDLIIAGESAKFGQPEIHLGIIPGAGGTQRLARFIGKAKAMDLCLTGRNMDAEEAERCGLVSRVVPDMELMNEALKVAEKIAAQSMPSITMAKEAVNRAYETSLQEGVLFERRAFQSLFATEDQKEGMTAFIDKRPPRFNHR